MLDDKLKKLLATLTDEAASAGKELTNQNVTSKKKKVLYVVSHYLQIHYNGWGQYLTFFCYQHQTGLDILS